MQNDKRCCGSGACIIDTQGRCWCGQQWDGEKMCIPFSHIESASLRGIEPTANPSPPATFAVGGDTSVKQNAP